MSKMEYMHEYLIANSLLPKEENKLELDLKMLFKKDAFMKIVAENVKKDNKKEESEK